MSWLTARDDFGSCDYGRVNRTIDFSALTNTVSPDQVRAFKATAKQRGWGVVSTAQAVIGTFISIFVVGIGGTIGLIFVILGALTFSENPNPVSFGALALPAIFVLLFLSVGTYFLVRFFGLRRWEGWHRLDTFATSNGLVFSPRDAAPAYPGAIFNHGHSRAALNHIRSAEGRFLDFGNYRYVVGSGDDSRTYNWGFLAFKLDRSLPHIVLDATSNNGLLGGTNLPAFFKKEQKLSLEGDFDKHFTLYCPKGYERDALYIFTPDLMALLIDEASPFDVEIVDDWMFVYSASTFTTAKPEVYRRLFRIIETVGAKTLSQTERYADERIGDRTINLVAPQGQRLKRGIPVGAVIVTSLVVVLWGWGFVSDLVAY